MAKAMTYKLSSNAAALLAAAQKENALADRVLKLDDARQALWPTLTQKQMREIERAERDPAHARNVARERWSNAHHRVDILARRVREEVLAKGDNITASDLVALALCGGLASRHLPDMVLRLAGISARGPAVVR